MLNQVLTHFVDLFMVSRYLLMIDVLPNKGVYLKVRVDNTHIVDVEMIIELLSNGQEIVFNIINLSSFPQNFK